MRSCEINVFYDSKEKTNYASLPDSPQSGTFTYRVGGMALEVMMTEMVNEDLLSAIRDFPGYGQPLTKDGAARGIEWVQALSFHDKPVSTGMFRCLFQEAQEDADSCLWMGQEGRRDKYQEDIKNLLKTTPFLPFRGREIRLETCGDYLASCFINYVSKIDDFRTAFNALVLENSGNSDEWAGKYADRSKEVFENLCRLQNMGCRVMYSSDVDRYVTVYQIRNLWALLAIEYSHMQETGSVIRKCGNCGRLFIPERRSDEKYCSFPLAKDPGKTCRDVGAEKTFRRKVDGDRMLKAYRRESARISMAIKRAKEGGDDFILERSKNDKTALIQKRADVLNGTITEEDFINWIENRNRGKHS